jgi:hypothetical protein
MPVSAGEVSLDVEAASPHGVSTLAAGKGLSPNSRIQDPAVS